MFGFRSLAVAVALASAAIAAPSAQAATYIGNRAVGDGSVNFSITTDGTVGVLGSANILSYIIELTNLDGTFTLTESNSARSIAGGSLSATANDLLFDFGGATGTYALFQAPTIGSGDTFYCLQVSGCFDPTGTPGEAVEATNDFSFPYVARQGVQVIGSVATPGAVPEPATWAMMLLGFGAVGAALRQAKRQKLSVRYA